MTLLPRRCWPRALRRATVVVERLLDLLNRGIYPVVPEQGSVGASGDLAPLAHLALVLIGEGEAEVAGERVPRRRGAAARRRSSRWRSRRRRAWRYQRHARHGGAGRAGRCSTPARCAAGRRGRRHVASRRCRAPTRRSTRASTRSGRSRSRSARRNLCARCRRTARSASPTVTATRGAGRLLAALHAAGARRRARAFAFAGGVLERELGSVTDNPLMFPDDGDVLTGGNFHGQPLAQALDMLAHRAGPPGGHQPSGASSGWSTRTSRRSPAVPDPRPRGCTPGYMIAQITAAALVGECKTLAPRPAWTRFPPCARKEDHVAWADGRGVKAAPRAA